MGSVLWVAAGGALGAVGRYGISLLPWKSPFPLLTLVTNFLGALVIGFLSGLLSAKVLGTRGGLFWKTGVCGGFTTFSTFSNDGLILIKQGFYGLFALYTLLSILLGIFAVWGGNILGKTF